MWVRVKKSEKKKKEKEQETDKHTNKREKTRAQQGNDSLLTAWNLGVL
jgi:hypothetical protein